MRPPSPMTSVFSRRRAPAEPGRLQRLRLVLEAERPRRRDLERKRSSVTSRLTNCGLSAGEVPVVERVGDLEARLVGERRQRASPSETATGCSSVKTFRGAFCSTRPASRSPSANGRRRPVERRAARGRRSRRRRCRCRASRGPAARCSTVSISASPLLIVVRRSRLSADVAAQGDPAAGPVTSVRTNTIPVSASAGFTTVVTSRPKWSPMPRNVTGERSVLWFLTGAPPRRAASARPRALRCARARPSAPRRSAAACP